MANTKYINKIIGTSVLAVFIFCLTLVGYSYAQANGQGGDNRAYKFEGAVVSITSDEMVINTDDGSEHFYITNKTTFTRGADYTDIESGDYVYVISKMTDDGYVANVIQVDSGAAYGRDW